MLGCGFYSGLPMLNTLVSTARISFILIQSLTSSFFFYSHFASTTIIKESLTFLYHLINLTFTLCIVWGGGFGVVEYFSWVYIFHPNFVLDFLQGYLYNIAQFMKNQLIVFFWNKSRLCSHTLQMAPKYKHTMVLEHSQMQQCN